jgi:hypothetical protein
MSSITRYTAIYGKGENRGLGLQVLSTAGALGLQYLFDVSPDFLMLHEFAALGGGNAPFHTFTKMGVVLQQAQGGIFHQLFSVGAAVIGNLR